MLIIIIKLLVIQYNKKILNPKILTKFLENYCELIYRDKKNVKRITTANPELIRKIFSKIESCENKQFLDNLSKHEYFSEFKETFSKDFKEKEHNYPKVQEEEEDRSVSVIINDNPFLFLKTLAKKNLSPDKKNSSSDKNNDGRRGRNVVKRTRPYLPNFGSSDEDENENVFGIRKRKQNLTNLLPTFSQNDLDDELDDILDDDLEVDFDDLEDLDDSFEEADFKNLENKSDFKNLANSNDFKNLENKNDFKNLANSNDFKNLNKSADIVGRKRDTKNLVNLPPKLGEIDVNDLENFSFDEEDDDKIKDLEDSDVDLEDSDVDSEEDTGNINEKDKKE